MILSKHNSLFRYRIDQSVATLLFSLTLASACLLLLIIFFLFKESLPVLTLGMLSHFITDSGWYPLEGQFGILAMVAASITMMLGAIVLATPLGLAGAIFVCFYAGATAASVYQKILILLAGIPSVVFGLWGLTSLVPLISHIETPGTSLLAAIIVLTLMVLPTITVTSISALQAVPTNILLGAEALGMTITGKILFVVLPAARNGIISGILLSMARALGETMAVLMVAGNVVQMPGSLFDSVRALTANIALEMAYATGEHRASLFISGLLLTFVVMLIAWLVGKLEQRNHV